MSPSAVREGVDADGRRDAATGPDQSIRWQRVQVASFAASAPCLPREAHAAVGRCHSNAGRNVSIAASDYLTNQVPDSHFCFPSLSLSLCTSPNSLSLFPSLSVSISLSLSLSVCLVYPFLFCCCCRWLASIECCLY